MNTKTVFDKSAAMNGNVDKAVNEFLNNIETLEISQGNKIIIHQDGVEKSYYIRCCLLGKTGSPLIDLNARLIPESPDSYRANRELLIKNKTFQRMSQDAASGREFNDIIAEYNTSYSPEKPLTGMGRAASFESYSIGLRKRNLQVSRFQSILLFN